LVFLGEKREYCHKLFLSYFIFRILAKLRPKNKNADLYQCFFFPSSFVAISAFLNLIYTEKFEIFQKNSLKNWLGVAKILRKENIH
jgi:hypothetical protein